MNVMTKGSNSCGQLGIKKADTSQIFSSVKFPPNQVFVHAVCGSNNSLLLTNQSIVWGFGDNSKNQLGLTQAHVIKPTRIKSLYGIPIIQLAAGKYHTLALTKTGLIFGSGSDLRNQLGSGKNLKHFQLLEFFSGIFMNRIAYGFYSGSIDEYGSVYVWGINGFPPQCHELPNGEKFVDLSFGEQGRYAVLTSKNRLFVCNYFDSDGNQVHDLVQINNVNARLSHVTYFGDSFLVLANQDLSKQMHHNQIKIPYISSKNLQLLFLNSNSDEVIQNLFSSLSTLNGCFLLDSVQESSSNTESGVDLETINSFYQGQKILYHILVY